MTSYNHGVHSLETGFVHNQHASICSPKQHPNLCLKVNMGMVIFFLCVDVQRSSLKAPAQSFAWHLNNLPKAKTETYILILEQKTNSCTPSSFILYVIYVRGSQTFQRTPFFVNLLLCGPLFANLLFCRPQLYVTLFLSSDSFPMILIKIQSYLILRTPALQNLGITK